MTPRAAQAAALLASVFLTLVASGQARAEGPRPPTSVLSQLASVPDADPLELARLTRLLGDRVILAGVAAASPVEMRLAAIRATPYLRAPELALPALADAMTARDSLVACEAARVLYEIVLHLDRDALARRESDVDALAQVLTALHAVADREAAMPPVRQLAAASAAMLAGMGIGAATGS